ncbi:hypothetical protein [Rubrivirga sp. IMCC45206]|uniref:hypothetical protein n=1 Tax=Rubrivirga sp. IMCC45206 TaxID=3391614 RepID=UPI0039900DF5
MSDHATPDGISLFSTLDAFRDGLTSTLSRPAAASVCRGWAEKIDATDRSDLGGIRDGLTTLADQLEDETASASAVGQTMQSLGAHTAEAASTIDEDHLEAPLLRLGGYLKAAGIALAGGTRADQIEGISTDTHPTPGDPELRTVNTAPSATRHSDHADRAGVKGPTHDLADDVHDVAGDATPGIQLSPK